MKIESTGDKVFMAGLPQEPWIVDIHIRHEGSHFSRVPILRHFVLGVECSPVLQWRDMQHSGRERDGLMFLHGIK